VGKPTALNNAITGQAGSYLADFLLTQGYRVVGMVRRASMENFEGSSTCGGTAPERNRTFRATLYYRGDDGG